MDQQNMAPSSSEVNSLFPSSCLLCSGKFSTSQPHQPKLLPCLHTFCQQCIDTKSVSKEANRSSFTCPIDSQECKSINGIIDQFFVLEKLYKSESCQRCDHQCAGCFDEGVNQIAVGFCKQCSDWLCDSCVAAHRKVKVTKDHVILSTDLYYEEVKSRSKIQNCVSHPSDVLSLFCDRCEILTCRMCIQSDHAGHEYSYINLKAGTERSVVHDLVGQVLSKKNLLSKQQEELSERKTAMQSREKAITREIDETLNRVINALKERRNQLLGDLRLRTGAGISRLDKQFQILSKICKIMDFAIGFSRSAALYEDPFSLLQSRKPILSQLRNLLKVPIASLASLDAKIEFKSEEKNLLVLLSTFGAVVDASFPKTPEPVNKKKVMPQSLPQTPPGTPRARFSPGSASSARVRASRVKAVRSAKGVSPRGVSPRGSSASVPAHGAPRGPALGASPGPRPNQSPLSSQTKSSEAASTSSPNIAIASSSRQLFPPSQPQRPPVQMPRAPNMTGPRPQPNPAPQVRHNIPAAPRQQFSPSQQVPANQSMPSQISPAQVGQINQANFELRPPVRPNIRFFTDAQKAQFIRFTQNSSLGQMTPQERQNMMNMSIQFRQQMQYEAQMADYQRRMSMKQEQQYAQPSCSQQIQYQQHPPGSVPQPFPRMVPNQQQTRQQTPISHQLSPISQTHPNQGHQMTAQPQMQHTQIQSDSKQIISPIQTQPLNSAVPVSEAQSSVENLEMSSNKVESTTRLGESPGLDEIPSQKESIQSAAADTTNDITNSPVRTLSPRVERSPEEELHSVDPNSVLSSEFSSSHSPGRAIADAKEDKVPRRSLFCAMGGGSVSSDAEIVTLESDEEDSPTNVVSKQGTSAAVKEEELPSCSKLLDVEVSEACESMEKLKELKKEGTEILLPSLILERLKEEPTEPEVVDAFEQEEWCAVCDDGGETILCDTCPKIYHLECHVPLLKKPPNGQFSCSLCCKVNIPRKQRKRKVRRQLTAEDRKVCEKLLLKLFTAQDSLDFHTPIPPEVEGYYETIESPMDLTTIKKKLAKSLGSCDSYKSVPEFIRDVELVFSNALKFNGVESELGKIADKHQRYFEEQCELYFNCKYILLTEDAPDDASDATDEFSDESEANSSASTSPVGSSAPKRSRKR